MRRQLAALVAATTTLVLLAFLAPIVVLLRSGAERSAISEATLQAQSLAPVVAQLAPGSEPALPGSGLAVTVFPPTGQPIGAPASRGPSVALAARGQAFVARADDGVEVLVPVQGDQGTWVIRVFVTGSALHRGVTRTALVLAGLGLVLVGVGVLVADRLGRRLTGSVQELAVTADRLAAGDRDARVTPTGPPEVVQVGSEINRLADRITELLAAEREEVADLAHRLRTPLTALRLTADGTPVEPSVDSLERAVDEVIRAARRPVRGGFAGTADLAAVARDRAGFWAALAEEDGRALTVDLPGEVVFVRASVEDLAAALDALLGNVFAHTPDGSPLRVSLAGRALSVDDAGPGIDPAALQRGASGAGSTGLGLDVARRTAEAAGGTFVVGKSPLGGARVTLRF